MSALEGVRIVELAEGVAGEYCGKLLSDFGAEVIKVERLVTGSPTRAMSPRIEKGKPLEESGLFAYLNTNKKSVTVDLSTPDGQAALRDLLASAEVAIDDHGQSWLRDAKCLPEDLERLYPGLVFCSVTGFGFGAAPELDNAQSLNVVHASGWGFHTPTPPDVTRPPLKGPGRFFADYDAGLEAAIAVLGALYRRGRTGDGDFVDVSKQDALIGRADTVVGRMLAGELEPRIDRTAFDHRGPPASFRCSNGFVYLFITSRAHWAGLKELMGHPQWVKDFADDWLEFGITDESIANFRARFGEWVLDKERADICERAQKLGVPLVPVNDAADLQRSEQLQSRGFFQNLEHPVLGPALYPTVSYKLSASPAKLKQAAPSLGEHNGKIGARTVEAPRQGSILVENSPTRSVGGPLQGVRVLEITKVWAGPYAGKLLAFLGAEVIKVESNKNLDEMRAWGGQNPDDAPHYLSLNPGILSVQLNLKAKGGADYLRELIAKSDIVINNIKPGAMERAGLGYEELRKIKKDIISVSLKMNGNDGPLAYQTGYAPCFAALAGMNYLVGYDGETPRGMNISYGDSTCGAAAAFGALAALMHRERTGEGQFVDVSAVEAMASVLGDCLFEYSLTGKVPGPDGNRHADMAPHGCYPCRNDEWISIAIADDAQWLRLCEVLNAPELAQSREYASLAGRQANVKALDEQLSNRTSSHYAAALAGALRKAGVPAFKSQNALDVISDNHLWERSIFTTVTDNNGKARPIVGASWQLARAPVSMTRGAPKLGEHNEHVYRNILGVSETRMQELIEAGVID